MFQNCLGSFSDILNQKRVSQKKKKKRLLKMLKYKMTYLQSSFQLPHLADGVWER